MGGARCRHPPCIWVHLHAGLEYPRRGQRQPAWISPGCRGTPKMQGQGLLSLLCREGRRFWPSTVTSSAQPPGPGAATAAPTLHHNAAPLEFRHTPRPPEPLEQEKGGETCQRVVSGSVAQRAPKPSFTISTLGTSGQGLPFSSSGDGQVVPHI